MEKSLKPKNKNMKLPDLVMRSLELAAVWHLGQKRKHPLEVIPYIAHPVQVGYLLQSVGAPEHVIAAGILHDVVEDSSVTEKNLVLATNPKVARLVMEVSEPKSIKDWQKRKDAFLVSLSKASKEALLIKCADHVSNLRSLLEASKASPDVWRMFNGDREHKLAYEQAIFGLIKKKIKSPLVGLQNELLKKVSKI